MLNSRRNLSTTISICKSPKNPHLNPNPNASEVSGAYESEASFNCNFSNASLKSS